MPSDPFDRLRVPIALGLGVLLLAGYLVIRRADADSTVPSPTASVIVGQPGGGVVTPSPVPTPSPSPSALATPSPLPTNTPAPTPTPVPEAFTADVQACRSISGAECIDELRRLRDEDDTFVALILFDNAVAGDVMNVILDGPTGPLEGGEYALPGGGRGYYYSTFAISGIPEGEYTLTALRNGQAVARTELRRSGGDDD